MQGLSTKNVYLPATLILILGLSISLIFAWLQYQKSVALVEGRFERDAMVYSHAIEREITLSQQVVEDLAAFFQVMPQLDRRAFTALANAKFKHHKGIQALEWVPKVLPHERETYERNARQDFPDFEFRDKNAKGEIVTAQPADIYFPVYYLEPFQGNESALGLSPTFTEEREKAINLAISTGRSIASQRIYLIQEKQSQFGMLIFSPVYQTLITSEDYYLNLEKLVGLTLGVFRLGDLVENALNHQQKLPLNLALFDGNGATEKQFLYLHSNDQKHGYSNADLARFTESQAKDTRLYRFSVNRLGREWIVKIYPQSGFYLPAMESVYTYLATGSLLSLLCALFVFRWRIRQLMAEQNLTLSFQATRSRLDGKENTLLRQNAALTHLASSLYNHSQSLEQSLSEILEITAKTVQVERVSAWFLADENQLIRCYDLFELSKGFHSKGTELHAENYPKYFSAILQNSEIVADDARANYFTSEFVDDYLQPSKINALLYIPLRHQGEIVGVVCLEHVGATRYWTSEEIHFSKSIANFISLAVESIRRYQAELRLRETGDRLALINNITSSIGSGMSVDQVIDITLIRLAEEFPRYRVAYSTITEAGTKDVLRCYSPKNMPSIAGTRVELSVSVEYLRMLRNRQPVIASDISRDRRFDHLKASLTMQKSAAVLDMPLTHKSDLVGLISLDSRKLHHWHKHEIAVMTEVAEFLELAIRDARGQEAREAAEKALARQKDNLEKLVKIRTAELERRAHLELIVANFSTEFINLPVEHYKKGIENALKTVGEFCGVELASFIEVKKDEDTVFKTHQWATEGVQAFISDRQQFKLSQYSWVQSQLRSNRVVYLRDINELADVAEVEYQFLADRQVKTLILIPVIYGLKLAGIFQLSTQNYYITCNQDDITLFQLIGNMLMNVSERTKYDKELKKSEKLLLKSNKKLKSLATIDGLTGIANRRVFDMQLQTEFRRAQREQYALSLIFFDIDNFKEFNDEFGHVAGDLCLKRVATTIKDHCQRATEFAARYGGEEFVVILANVNEDVATGIAERIRKSVLSLAITAPSSADSNFLTLCGGVASWVPDLEQTPEAILQAADKALYQAKSDGRNCVRVANNQSVVNFRVS